MKSNSPQKALEQAYFKFNNTSKRRDTRTRDASYPLEPHLTSHPPTQNQDDGHQNNNGNGGIRIDAENAIEH